MRISDWSSDVCSSYLGKRAPRRADPAAHPQPAAPGQRRVHSARDGGKAQRGLQRRPRAGGAVRTGARPGRRRLAAGDPARRRGARSEERRVGKEGVGTGRDRWWPENEKKNKEV